MIWCHFKQSFVSPLIESPTKSWSECQRWSCSIIAFVNGSLRFTNKNRSKTLNSMQVHQNIIVFLQKKYEINHQGRLGVFPSGSTCRFASLTSSWWSVALVPSSPRQPGDGFLVIFQAPLQNFIFGIFNLGKLIGYLQCLISFYNILYIYIMYVYQLVV